MSDDSLTADELERYRRQLQLPDFGHGGQLALRRASVLVVGAGGLGSPVLLYLAAAGVGHITVADGDNVDLSNLQRQIIHSTAAVGTSKATSAARRMLALNPALRVETVSDYLDADSLAPQVDKADIVVDATDNFASKFLINDTCVARRRPYVHGGICAWGGQVMTYVPGHACYRCLYGDEPPAAGPPSGPIGFLPGIIGSIQAGEVVKYLSGAGALLTDTVLSVDTLTMDFVRLGVAPDPACRVCGDAAAVL